MVLELIIWHDNVSGTTHICKRTSEGRDVHLTPQSASEEEKNLIEEMCNRVKKDYGIRSDYDRINSSS